VITYESFLMLGAAGAGKMSFYRRQFNEQCDEQYGNVGEFGILQRALMSIRRKFARQHHEGKTSLAE
jgi:hypothetical protein